MTDRPIIFSAPMIRALLAGRKTMTRRLVKRGPLRQWIDSGFTLRFINDPGNRVVMPYQPGDRLYVREQFSGERAFGAARVPIAQWDVGSKIWYWADGNPTEGDWTKPRPSIHMPRWMSRLTLTVTAVRVERLQEISEEDAIAEGCPLRTPYGGDTGLPFYKPGTRGDAVGWFAGLWEHLHGPGAWDANPGLVALTFTVGQHNIDHPPTP